MFEYGEVVRGGLGAGAHLVVVERDIHDPVQSVLNGPVRADDLADAPASGARLLLYRRCSWLVLSPMVRSDSRTMKQRNPFHCCGLSRHSS